MEHSLALMVIQARRATLRQAIKAASEEESALDAAERALIGATYLHPEPRRKRSDISQSGMILNVLRDAPHPWIDTPEILQAMVSQVYGVQIKAGSMHALLSVLKKKGRVVRHHKKLALAERAASETSQ